MNKFIRVLPLISKYYVLGAKRLFTAVRIRVLLG